MLEVISHISPHEITAALSITIDVAPTLKELTSVGTTPDLGPATAIDLGTRDFFFQTLSVQLNRASRS